MLRNGDKEISQLLSLFEFKLGDLDEDMQIVFQETEYSPQEFFDFLREKVNFIDVNRDTLSPSVTHEKLKGLNQIFTTFKELFSANYAENYPNFYQEIFRKKMQDETFGMIAALFYACQKILPYGFCAAALSPKVENQSQVNFSTPLDGNMLRKKLETLLVGRVETLHESDEEAENVEGSGPASPLLPIEHNQQLTEETDRTEKINSRSGSGTLSPNNCSFANSPETVFGRRLSFSTPDNPPSPRKPGISNF